MFESDFLDFFSRIPAWVVPMIYVPVVTASVGLAAYGGVSVGWIAAQFVFGWFVWTLLEYWAHRTLFHWVPSASWGEKFHFYLHGVHHQWFKDKLRLVMPPAVSIGISIVLNAVLYGLALLLEPWFSPTWPFAFYGGIAFGYMVYDLTHYYIHHFKPRTAVGRALRAHHNKHHHNPLYKDLKFGVSTTLWDHVFNTYELPAEQRMQRPLRSPILPSARQATVAYGRLSRMHVDSSAARVSAEDDTRAFRERLLQIMERKTHWAWPLFTSGHVSRDLLHLHLEHEWEVYVRDFPVLLGRAYVQCPIPEVRQDLAENLYEEETGGIAAGRPHPDLFLEIPRGLGMRMERFDTVALLPAARAYRNTIDAQTQLQGWAVATAVTTLYLEGNAYERAIFDEDAPRRPEPSLDNHPLVRHYGLPVERLALVKAHRAVEGDHRLAAWRMILDHTPRDQREAVVRALEVANRAWLAYRDEIAAAVGLVQEA